MKIIVINGVNINLMGQEPQEINGNLTLDKLEEYITSIAKEMDIELDFFQSNIEGEIVNKIHNCKNVYDGILINLGSYSFTSFAIADAITNTHIPTIELMMNNFSFYPDKRKKGSVVLPSCLGLISGFGPFVFQLGLLSIHNAVLEINLLKKNSK